MEVRETVFQVDGSWIRGADISSSKSEGASVKKGGLMVGKTIQILQENRGGIYLRWSRKSRNMGFLSFPYQMLCFNYHSRNIVSNLHLLKFSGLWAVCFYRLSVGYFNFLAPQMPGWGGLPNTYLTHFRDHKYLGSCILNKLTCLQRHDSEGLWRWLSG